MYIYVYIIYIWGFPPNISGDAFLLFSFRIIFAGCTRLGNGSWTNANAGSLGTQRTSSFPTVVVEAMDEHGPFSSMICDDL